MSNRSSHKHDTWLKRCNMPSDCWPTLTCTSDTSSYSCSYGLGRAANIMKATPELMSYGVMRGLIEVNATLLLQHVWETGVAIWHAINQSMCLKRPHEYVFWQSFIPSSEGFASLIDLLRPSLMWRSRSGWDRDQQFTQCLKRQIISYLQSSRSTIALRLGTGSSLEKRHWCGE